MNVGLAGYVEDGRFPGSGREFESRWGRKKENWGLTGIDMSRVDEAREPKKTCVRVYYYV